MSTKIGVLALLCVCSLGVAAPFDTIYDTLWVDGTSYTEVFSKSLQSGQQYLIEVTGTYRIAGATWADAEWAQYVTGSWDDPNDLVEYWPGGAPELVDVAINGQDVNWMGTSDEVVDTESVFAPHTYSPSHTYRYYLVGDGNSVAFSIYDDPYNDNAGGLDVTIFIPEPAVLSLLTVGGVVLLQRKRK